MNKLYILGALLLSSAEAGKLSLTNTATATSTTTSTVLFGSYTYTVSADCLASSTVTTLGLNNKYYQYYSFPIATGKQSWAAPAPVAGTSNYAGTFAYNGCYHQHLANWMATPAVSTVAVQGGLGNQAVAYGYALTGTTVTACTNTIATTILYSSTAKTFTGAQYQSSSVYLSPGAPGITAVQTTITTSVRVKQGLENYDAVVVKASAIAEQWVIATTEGIVTTSTAATNYYWDFMQTNVFQGMTSLGRGGGSSTAPCGWWVIYALEQPGAVTATGQAIVNSAGYSQNEDAYPSLQGVTVSMWTDNSIMTVASSLVLSALATILF